MSARQRRGNAGHHDQQTTGESPRPGGRKQARATAEQALAMIDDQTQPDVPRAIPSWDVHGVKIAPPDPHARNKPPILTQAIADRLIYASKQPVSRQAMARFAGISLQTLYDYLRLGRHGDERYAAMVTVIDERDYDIEALASGSLLQQARTNPIAALGLLERRYPDRWGLKHQVEVKVKGEIESMLTFLREQISPEAFEEVIRALVAYSGDSASPQTMAIGAESDILDAEFRDVS